MSLYNWQSLLITALRNPSEASDQLVQKQIRLEPHERIQLTAMNEDKGACVTQDVANWWRLARLTTALPFSLKLISRLGLEQVTRQYQTQPFKTLFFLREAELFLDFLRSQHNLPDILSNLAHFEYHLHCAKRHHLSSPYFYQFTVQYCPYSTIASLLQNTPLPNAMHNGGTIRISSDWPKLWQLEEG